MVVAVIIPPHIFSIAKSYTIDMPVEKSNVRNSGIYVICRPAVPVVYAIGGSAIGGTYEFILGSQSSSACAGNISKLGNRFRLLDTKSV